MRAIVWFLLLLPLAVHGEDFGFDVGAYEKKPFEFGGFGEAKAEYLALDNGTAGYPLAGYNTAWPRVIDRYTGALELQATWRHDMLRAELSGRAEGVDDGLGTARSARFYQAYLGWQLHPRLGVDLGKKTFGWGKGYAWNPVAFIDRPKDPGDPELAREGYIAAGADWVRSGDGKLQTVAFTPVVVPVTEDINTDFGETGHTNPAFKLYALLLDTDIDLMALSDGSRSARYGLDFSRNLGSNLEVHGEWARIDNYRQTVLRDDGSRATRLRDIERYLLGLRYLTPAETTYIAEYYYNGGGYTREQMERFFTLVHTAADDGDDDALDALRDLAATGYTGPAVMRRYGYLRVSQKEPFDIVYLTAAMTAVVNLEDDSHTLIPEIIYTGFNDVELRLRLNVNSDETLTEYGEKPARYRTELRLRYYF